MVIQHNLAALNANRISNKNSVKLSKSLEKLSSGYDINRAGDNAAGLAVSEKMRTQIFGMNQSVKNCQDGVSLIQTFEGALNETGAIIERMKALAVQSANGSYDDMTDRAAVEAEYNQLCDEVDQIADTDFNGLVLLNGRNISEGFDCLSEKQPEKIIPRTIGLKNYKSTFGYSDDYKMSIKLLPGMAGRHVDNEIFFALLELEEKIVVNADVENGIPKYSFAVGSEGWSIRNDPDEVQSGIISYEASSGEVIDLAKVSIPLIHSASTVGYGMLDTSHIVHHQSINGARYTSCSINIFVEAAANAEAAFNDAVKYRDHPVDYITDLNGNLYNKANTSEIITYDDLKNNHGIYVQHPDMIADDSLFNINGSINVYNDGQKITGKTFSDDYMKSVFLNAGHSITYTFNGTGWANGGTVETALNGYNTTGKTNGDTMTIKVETIKEQYFNGFYYNPNTQNFELTLAEPAVDYGKAIDGETYSYNGTDWVKKSTNQTVDLKDEGINLPAGIKLFKGMRFTVSNVLSGPTGNIKSGVKLFDAPFAYNMDLILQSGSRTKDAVNFTFDYDSEGIGGLNTNLDCTALGLGLRDLTLSTQEDANLAIDNLDHAQNKVSLIRATFGAVQNRLEHKIDNLNNTNENLTAAESSIRDADVAKEMMNFTKEQILSQASQSMLAQANSLPQQVMSLIAS